MKLGIIVGSLRRESFSRVIAENVAKLLPSGITAEFIPIDLPMYGQDFDDDGMTPDSWPPFRECVKGCDAFLFVTPEYNRSMPPVLKNALDIASRPYGHNMWAGKKGAIISVSPGAIGGFGANHALRQVCVFLDLNMLAQPEMYIGGVTGLLEGKSGVNEKTRAFLADFAKAFAAFLEK